MHEPLPASLPTNSIPASMLSIAGDEQPFPPLGPNINVLMIWPRFPSSFWGFEGVLEMLPEAAARSHHRGRALPALLEDPPHGPVLPGDSRRRPPRRRPHHDQRDARAAL